MSTRRLALPPPRALATLRGMRGLMGTFALMPLQDLVEFLARRGTSGSLTCERGTVRKTVHFVEGVAVSAASNDPREYLGQLLINFGHLDEDALAKAFATQQETKIRLGKVLTMVGLVTADIVRETLAIKIRETILDAFVWDSGVFRVDEAAPPAPDELDPRVPLADIAREAEFRRTAWEAFRAQFPSGTLPLVVHEENLRAPPPPNSVDARLLRLAREGKTIDEIGLALHASDFHVYQRLYALRTQGVVEAAQASVHHPENDIAHARALLVAARVALESDALAEAEAQTARALELAPALEAAATLHAEVRRRLGEQLRSELLAAPRRPKLKVRAHEVALMRLPAAEKYLLARCDGSRDLRAIVELAPIAELDVLLAVKRFVDGKIVDLG
jgi:uncharacterized protein DUF4388